MVAKLALKACSVPVLVGALEFRNWSRACRHRADKEEDVWCPLTLALSWCVEAAYERRIPQDLLDRLVAGVSVSHPLHRSRANVGLVDRHRLMQEIAPD